MEIWKAVPEWDGLYEVSDQGRVRSLDRVSAGRYGPTCWRGRILRPSLGGNGYANVTFTCQGKRLCVTIHALVARVFLGPPPPGQEVRHRNGIRADSRLSNLHYGTRSQNALDRYEHGTMVYPCGEKSPVAKLSDNAVKYIRAAKEGQRALGRRFGVHHRTISAVLRGDTWAHVSEES